MKFHEFADVFPMLSDLEQKALAADIKAHGLLQPIVTFEGAILDGRNRFRACSEAGVEPKYRAFSGTRKDALDAVSSWNLHRRHLTVGQRAAIVPKLDGFYQKIAGERQEAGRKAGGHARQGSSKANLPASSEPSRQSRDDTGKALGISGRTVEDARVVASKGSPKLKEAMAEGKVSVSAAAQLASLDTQMQDEIIAQGKKTAVAEANAIRAEKQKKKRVEKAETVRKIVSESLAFPEGPFRVLVVDPPWKYDARAEDDSHRARNPYPDMTIDEIKRLPVASLSHKDAVLWLWTTNAFLRDAFDIAAAWDFTPKTVLTWDKETLGLGDWLRNVTEHCLLCVKGKPVVTLTNQTTLIREKRRQHSRKPEGFYAMVETLCHGNRVELFSREGRDGWSAWGAEVEKFHAV